MNEKKILVRWYYHIRDMPSERFDTLQAGHRRKPLVRKGWNEIMPGMWVKNLMGPFSTKDAFKYDAELELMWETYTENIRAPHLLSRGWKQLGPSRWVHRSQGRRVFTSSAAMDIEKA